MLVKFLFILLIINFCLCSYRDCGSRDGSLINVSISNCKPEKKRCILKKNRDVKITITFTNVEAKRVQSEVCGSLSMFNFFCVPFRLLEPNGCKSGIKCPVKTNQINTYETSINVESTYPNVAVDVKWKLKDENEEDIICIIIPSDIR